MYITIASELTECFDIVTPLGDTYFRIYNYFTDLLWNDGPAKMPCPHSCFTDACSWTYKFCHQEPAYASKLVLTGDQSSLEFSIKIQ